MMGSAKAERSENVVALGHEVAAGEEQHLHAAVELAVAKEQRAGGGFHVAHEGE